MDKILLTCATKKGYEVLLALTNNFPELIGAVCSFRETNMQEQYYESIVDTANEFGIPIIKWNEFKRNPESILSTYNITVILAISWRYLLPIEYNLTRKISVIIIHDSLLPRYRGFAPLPTAIINGENLVGISCIYAGETVDSGSIILQKSCSVPSNRYIGSIIDDIIQLYKEAVLEIAGFLKAGKALSAKPQDENNASYSIWRNPEDCQIDWQNSSINIYNLVRAVSYPYSGAYTYLAGKKVHIWKSEVISEDLMFEIRQAGKIWKLDDNGCPTVICGKGMLKIIDATVSGESIIPITHLRQGFVTKNDI